MPNGIDVRLITRLELLRLRTGRLSVLSALEEGPPSALEVWRLKPRYGLYSRLSTVMAEDIVVVLVRGLYRPLLLAPRSVPGSV